MKKTKKFLLYILVLALSCTFTLSAGAWQYTVKPGDSMWRIGQNHGVALDDIIEANPQVKNPDLIYPGDVLHVPGDEQTEYKSDKVWGVLSATNSYRAKNGRSPLVLDSALCAVAQAKAEDMAARGYFSHTSPTYGSPADMLKSFGVSYRSMGENIAKGYDSATATVDAWMTSPGHRANILNAAFGKIGVGYSENGNIWVQIFTD